MQTIVHALLHAFGMVMLNFHVPPKTFNYNSRTNQLIRSYFTRQLVQISLFANILPLQNFPTYGNSYNYQFSVAKKYFLLSHKLFSLSIITNKTR